jgi:hypothetical protein
MSGIGSSMEWNERLNTIGLSNPDVNTFLINNWIAIVFLIIVSVYAIINWSYKE